MITPLELDARELFVYHAVQELVKKLCEGQFGGGNWSAKDICENIIYVASKQASPSHSPLPHCMEQGSSSQPYDSPEGCSTDAQEVKREERTHLTIMERAELNHLRSTQRSALKLVQALSAKTVDLMRTTQLTKAERQELTNLRSADRSSCRLVKALLAKTLDLKKEVQKLSQPRCIHNPCRECSSDSSRREDVQVDDYATSEDVTQQPRDSVSPRQCPRYHSQSSDIYGGTSTQEDRLVGRALDSESSVPRKRPRKAVPRKWVQEDTIPPLPTQEDRPSVIVAVPPPEVMTNASQMDAAQPMLIDQREQTNSGGNLTAPNTNTPIFLEKRSLENGYHRCDNCRLIIEGTRHFPKDQNKHHIPVETTVGRFRKQLCRNCSIFWNTHHDDRPQEYIDREMLKKNGGRAETINPLIVGDSPQTFTIEESIE